MGLNYAATVTENINRTVNLTTINAQQSIVNQNDQKSDVSQIIIQEIDGNVTCAGDYTLTNDARVNASALSLATAQQRNEMANEVTQALQATTKTELEQANEDIPVGDSNISTVVNAAVNETINEQQVNLKQAFENVISQTSNTSQTIIFRIGPTANVIVGGSCTFTNVTSIEYTAQVTTDAAMDTVIKNQSVQDAMAAWDTYVKQQNKGLSLGAILGIIIAVIIIFIAIGLMARFLPPLIAKKKAEAEAKKNNELNKPMLASSTPKSTS